MITHTHIRGIIAGTSSVSKRIEITGEQEVNIDIAIAASTTDQDIDYILDVSQLKSLFIVSDKALTLETNSGASPVNTFTLVANVPFTWRTGDAALRDTAGTVVTTDITSIFVTNSSSTSSAQLTIFSLIDPTV